MAILIKPYHILWKLLYMGHKIKNMVLFFNFINIYS